MVDKERDDDSGKVPQPTPGAKGTATVYAPPTVPHTDSTPTPMPAPTPGKKGVATVYAQPTIPQQSNPVSGSTGSQNPNDTSYQARQQQAQDQANTYYKERGLNPTQDQLNQKVSDYARSLEINGKLTPGTPEYDQALGNYLKANNLQLVPSTPNPKETSPPDYGKDNYGYTKDVKVSDVVKKGFTQNTSDIMSSDLGETIQNKPPSKAQQDLITAQAMKETFSGLSTGQPAQRKGIDVKLTQGTGESQAQLDQAASNAYDKASRLYGNNYFGSDDRTAIGSLAGKKVISNPNGAGLLIVPEKTLPENHIPLGNELIQLQQVKPQAKSPTAYTVGLYENVGISEGLGAGTSNVQSFVNDLVKQAKGDAAKTIDVLEITNYNAEGVQIQKTHTLESVPIEKAQQELPAIVEKYMTNPNVVYSHQENAAHPMIGSTLETTVTPNKLEAFQNPFVKPIAGLGGAGYNTLLSLGATIYSLPLRYQSLINDIKSGKYNQNKTPASDVAKAMNSLTTQEAQNYVEKNKFPEKTVEGIKGVLTGKGFEEFKTGQGPLYDIPYYVGEAASIILPVGKVPFINVAKIGEKSIVVASVGNKVQELFTISEGKVSRGFDITKIGEEGFNKISQTYNVKAKGGAELANLGEIESKVVSSNKNLNKLQEAGIFTKEDVDLINAGKVIVKESAKEPNKAFRDLGENPFEQIPAGPATEATISFMKENKIVVEGSAIDIPTFLPEFVGQAGDFDVHVASEAKAIQLAKAYTEKVNPLLNYGKPNAIEKIEFRPEGGKIYRYEGEKYVGKVGEFLSPEDETGQIAMSGKVLGKRTETKTMNINGLKMKTGRFQINRRIASITSIQPKGKGVEVGPPINKPGQGTTRAKDFPRTYAGTLTRAYVAKERGHVERELLLQKQAETIKRIGEKKINFEEFFKSRGRVTFAQEEKPQKTFEDMSKTGRTVTTGSNIISPILRSLTVNPQATLKAEQIKSKEKSPPPSPREESPIYNNKSVLNKSSLRTASRSVKSSSTSSLRNSSSLRSSITSKSKLSITSPQSPTSLSSPTSPKSPTLPASPTSPKSFKSLTSPKSPASPNSPASPTSPKSPTLPASPTSPKSPTSPNIPFTPPPKTPTKSIPFVIDLRNKSDQGIKLKPKPRADFLGNSSEIQVVGLYNRTETVYGLKKINKLQRQDYSKMTKGISKLVTSKSNSLTQKKHTSILTQNKKQNNTRIRF